MPHPIHLTNTLSRSKEEFTPLDPAHVRIYVCGPTVYDFAHLGNARPVVVFDTLYRLLKRHYPRVTYVRNITDIDDKIIAKARESGESIDAITTKTTQAYHEDMAALNALPPDVEPRCTQTIPQMLAMIQTLIEQRHAYVADSHVLFHVPSMQDYGRLSRRSRDELVAGARVEVAPYKKDPADFVLWKPSADDQPGWESPWGRGRPGWHIECSAMAKEHLGETFDIHGGGLDLIFPHHENEIAQSACANHKPLAKYWLHNGFLTINNDKMSKSLGNFFTVRQLLGLAPGEALRLALLSGHYRQPLDFSEDALTQAKATLDRWYGALRAAGELPSGECDVPENVDAALRDDLNTPLAIALIHEMVNAFYQASSPEDKTRLKRQILAAGAALGVLQQSAETWFKGAGATRAGPSESEIETAISARIAARKARDFKEADRIRDELATQGITLEDSPNGTTWRRG